MSEAKQNKTYEALIDTLGQDNRVLVLAFVVYLILSVIESTIRTFKNRGILDPIVSIQVILICSSLLLSILLVFKILSAYQKARQTQTGISPHLVITSIFYNIGAFSMTYYRIYQICPQWFRYDNTSQYSSKGMEQLAVYWDYLVFSAFRSLSQTYFRISEAHSLVSVLVLCQIGFSIFTVSVLLASYVSNHN